MYIRKQVFGEIGKESAFFWGARQTGKSTLLKYLFPDALYFDLLLNTEYERFLRNPSLLREIVEAQEGPRIIIIDEVQKLPQLLDEVQWLIVNRKRQFILSGSSPRNIMRSGGNLLGGRAFRYELYPLVYKEIDNFDLHRALNHGLLPRHYLSDNAEKNLAAYTGSYLKDEIMAEARIRNISSFSRFLEVSAFSNGEIVNYTNIAAECGVTAPTIREYFQILEDTLIGRFLPSYQKRPKRRVILSPKFYFFDVGIANYLLKRLPMQRGSENFGHAFEHFIYHEIYTYSHYSQLHFPLAYWHTASGFETDFILGDHEIAIEVQSTSFGQTKHLRGLRKFSEEYKTRQLILITTDPEPRKVDNITLLPWNIFLEKLWDGELIR